MMSEEQFSILKNQNDMIIKLLAASAIEGKLVDCRKYLIS